MVSQEFDKTFGEVMDEIRYWADCNDVYWYHDIVDYAMDYNEEWYRVASSNAGTRELSRFCKERQEFKNRL